MARLMAIIGDSGPGGRGIYAQCVATAVKTAQGMGFCVGAKVLIGTVPGRVIGHNITRVGRFAGTSYPVLVQTELGMVKCSIEELRLA